jgi:hypothetical protein
MAVEKVIACSIAQSLSLSLTGESAMPFDLVEDGFRQPCKSCPRKLYSCTMSMVSFAPY